jgi:predicted metal-dependent HD superfamily phosphohydrolase
MSALEPVRQCWKDIMARRSCAAEPAAAVLHEILHAHGAPHRHYHTLDHVSALLALLIRHGGAVLDRDALSLAILFHDLVYDPTRHDNEAASAALATERLTGLGLPEALVAKVGRYILATQHDRDTVTTGDADLALLLDLDLSILASAADEYRAYAQAVRREYAFVPDQLYGPGRRRVLEDFLARPSIYRTERLHALWEQSARANLAAEIAGLGRLQPAAAVGT